MVKNKILTLLLSFTLVFQLFSFVSAETDDEDLYNEADVPYYLEEGYVTFSDNSSCTDEQFFGIWNNGIEEWTTKSKINYDYTDELAKVEEAAKRADYELAKVELLEYYRTRSNGLFPEPETQNTCEIDLIVDGIFPNNCSFLTKDTLIGTQYSCIEIDVTDYLNERDGVYTLCFNARRKEPGAIRIASKESEFAPYVDAVVNGQNVKLNMFSDTYVRAVDYENEIFGLSEEILIHDSGAPIDSDTCIGYMQIDMSDIKETDVISSAKLMFYAKTDNEKASELMIFKDTRTIDENTETFATKKNTIWIVSWQGIESGSDWVWPAGYYGNFAEQITRFHLLDHFVRVYEETENEYYAYHALRLMFDFMQDQTHGYVTVLTEPIRTLSWYSTFFHMINSPYMTPTAATALIKWFYEGQDFLRTHFSIGSNWGTVQTKTFLRGCAVFPEFADKPLWLKTIRNRIENDIAPLILDDGAYIECSNSYALGTLDYVLCFFRDAKEVDLKFSDGFTEKVKRFAKYMISTMVSNGDSVEWGDGNPGSIRSHIKELGEVLDDREMIYIGTNGEMGKKPEWTSSVFPVGRRAFLRSGWAKDDTFLFINNYGGNIHGHSDSLHIYLDAYGTNLLEDTGKASYDLENDPIAIWQTYNSEAHNTVSVNGKGQQQKDSGETCSVLMTEFTDFYEGYTDANEGVRHTRNIFFVKPGYFIVSDLLSPDDMEAVNDYRQTWHTPYSGNVTIAPENKMAETHFNDRANLKIIPLDSENIEAEMKIGWSRHNEGSNPTAEVPYVSYGQTKEGAVSFDTVLYAIPAGEDKDVHVQRINTDYDKTDVTALKISADKNETYFMLAHSRQDVEKVFGEGNSFDGKMAFFEKNSYGNLSLVSIAGGKNLTALGKEIIKSNTNIENLAVKYESNEMYISTSQKGITAEVYVPEGVEEIFLNDVKIVPIMKGDYACIGDDKVSPPNESLEDEEKVSVVFKEAEITKSIMKNDVSEDIYTISISEDTVATGNLGYDGNIGIPYENKEEILLTFDYGVKFSKPVKLTNKYELSGACQYVTENGSRADVKLCAIEEIDDELKNVPVVKVGNDFYMVYNLKGYSFPINEDTDYAPLEPPKAEEDEEESDKKGSGGGSSGGGKGNSAGIAGTINNIIPKVEFADISGHWAEESIKKMTEKGVFTGINEKEFSPDGRLTRAQLAAIMLRIADAEIIPFMGAFDDVKKGDWYADILQTAKQKGILSGDGKNARPNDFVTREEMVKIVISAMEKLMGYEFNKNAAIDFKDKEQISSWAYSYVIIAAEEGIISGDDEFNFNPKANCSRAEAATVADRIFQRMQ